MTAYLAEMKKKKKNETYWDPVLIMKKQIEKNNIGKNSDPKIMSSCL